MRIDRVRLRPFRATPRTTWMNVEVGAGVATGLGEMSDIEPSAAAPALTEVLRTGIEGRGVAEARRWAASWGRQWASQPFSAAERLRRHTALGGIATALADLAARQAGTSLAGFLGGQVPGPIPVYANINRAMRARTPEAAAELAAAARQAGFGGVKCAPFDGISGQDRVRAGLRIAAAVREAIGPGAALFVDVHHRLTTAEVLAAAPELAALDIAWLEDAVPVTDVAALRRVRDAVGCPLAGGEFVADSRLLLPALRAGVLDVVMPDVKHAGGPEAALELARIAIGHGATASFHNPGGPVATAASGHATALLPPRWPLEIAFGELGTRPESVTPPERINAGLLCLAPGPGLGITLAAEWEEQPDAARTA